LAFFAKNREERKMDFSSVHALKMLMEVIDKQSVRET
jgi:hypothetical protein